MTEPSEGSDAHPEADPFGAEQLTTRPELDGRTVLIAGATSESGTATAAALVAAGARVVAVGSNAERLAALQERVPGAITYPCDLANASAVAELAAAVHADVGRIDGLIHLVGGWRGGSGLTGQSDGDWGALETGILTTLRNTSRAFFDDLVASDSGRLAIVSATAVDSPTASNANYATAKAAAETWVRAVAEGFRRAQSGAKENPVPQRAAGVSFVIKALVSDQVREESPDKPFTGYTDVEVLAEQITNLWAADAAAINGTRLPLAT